jgi:MYXO-CTERM domain-containing protein
VEFDNPSPLVAVSDDDIGSTALATYNFQFSIGPLGFDNGNLSTSDWVNQGTSQGNFTVTDFENVSFQGIVASASVPEPATLGFAALGLLGLFSLRRLLKTLVQRG